MISRSMTNIIAPTEGPKKLNIPPRMLMSTGLADVVQNSSSGSAHFWN